MSHARLFLIVTTVLILTSVRAAWASSVVLSPVRIHLSSAQQSQVLTLRNSGAELVRYQIVAYSWQQDSNGQMQLSPTRDLVVFPTLIELKPGAVKRVRVATTRPLDGVARTYRLSAEQLPATAMADTGQIRVLTRFSVPVFVQPPSPAARPKVQASVRDGRLSIALTNGGNSYFLTRSLRVVARARDGRVFFEQALPGWYVLSQGRRDYQLSLSKEMCQAIDSISVTATTEQETVSTRLGKAALACLQ